MKPVTIDDILENREGTTLLYRAIRGSHAFGLATEKSDVDEVWVYMCSAENLLDLGKEYQPVIENETQDIVVYEIGWFLKLLDKSNPNCLEAMFIPDDCVLYVHPLFRELLDMRGQFLTKSSFKPYIGYAKSQIDKARGLKKAIAKDPVEKRLTILDFCYVPTRHNQGSSKVLNWLEYRGLMNKYCGVTNIANMYNIHGLFYDWGQFFTTENIEWKDIADAFDTEYKTTLAEVVAALKSPDIVPEEKERLEKLARKMRMTNMIKLIMHVHDLHDFFDLLRWYQENKEPIGYRGMTNEDVTSDELRLSPVPKGAQFITVMSYNKDAYSSHCREYREYHEWLKHRNEERFRVNTKHGKNYDSKNMYSCCRIMLTAAELASTGNFRLRRPDDRDFLLSVKRGDLSYDEIIKFANNLNDQMVESMNTSELPDAVDSTLLNRYLISVRLYQLSKFINDNDNNTTH